MKRLDDRLFSLQSRYDALRRAWAVVTSALDAARYSRTIDPVDLDTLAKSGDGGHPRWFAAR